MKKRACELCVHKQKQVVSARGPAGGKVFLEQVSPFLHLLAQLVGWEKCNIA